MSPITEEMIKDALGRVTDIRMISAIVIRGGKVGFVITIDPKDKYAMEQVRETCEREVKKIPGVEAVTAVLTAQNSQPIAPGTSGYTQPRERAQWNLTPVENIKKVIAVASGKGGVGKSTTAVNLALALQALGKKVGLLDADIYGPSIPHMLGLSGQPEIKDGKMIPLVGHGIECMSMAFITGDEAAILRGPMISKTLHQLLRMTRWNALDILLIDMPPGTGDIHISMAQQVPLAGAIIVTTPQDVAILDARKALKMFVKVHVPVLGVIENMSGAIFGSGGGKKLAEEMGVPFLGEIPMDGAICSAADSGAAYSGNEMEAYRRIAEKLYFTT